MEEDSSVEKKCVGNTESIEHNTTKKVQYAHAWFVMHPCPVPVSKLEKDHYCTQW